MGISLDGSHRSVSGPTFYYHEDLQIDVIEPPAGLYIGGTQVRSLCFVLYTCRHDFPCLLIYLFMSFDSNILRDADDTRGSWTPLAFLRNRIPVHFSVVLALPIHLLL